MQFKTAVFFITLVLTLVPVSHAQQISNTRELNFGKIAQPASGSVSVVVNRNSSIGGGTSAIILDSSAVSAGRDKITGSGKKTVQISLLDCSSNSGLGLQIKDFKARYGGTNFTNSANGLSPPKRKGKNLTYGATLVVNSSTPGGTLTPCYSIEVNYD